MENLAIIVKGWGEGDASLEVRRPSGFARGKDLRIGHRQRLEATDLVVFVTIRATSPTRLIVSRQ